MDDDAIHSHAMPQQACHLNLIQKFFMKNYKSKTHFFVGRSIHYFSFYKIPKHRPLDGVVFIIQNLRVILNWRYSHIHLFDLVCILYGMYAYACISLFAFVYSFIPIRQLRIYFVYPLLSSYQFLSIHITDLILVTRSIHQGFVFQIGKNTLLRMDIENLSVWQTYDYLNLSKRKDCE